MPNYGSYYGSQAYGAQPVNWLGDFFGNLGNSWQGASDAPMYADPSGLPYATTSGAENLGAATVEGAKNVAGAIAAPALGFLSGVARSGGILLGVAIIAGALINESRD